MKVIFKERMAGKIFIEKKEIPAEFNIEAESDFTPYGLIRGELLFKIKGTLDTRAFSNECHCENKAASRNCGRCKNVSYQLDGWLKIDLPRRKLIYEFYFGDESLDFFFRGEKNVQIGGARKLLKTMTYLPGAITCDDDSVVPRMAVFRFDLKHDLPPMLLSFRLRFK